jgi:GTPase SAR1 family protein
MRIYFYLINRRQVKKVEGEKLKESYNLNLFMETSAKNGENIENLFINVSKVLFTNFFKYDNVKRISLNYFFRIH